MSGGISSDFRDIKAAMDDGNEVAKQTLEAYAYRVAKYIGSYVAAMNGVDAITFTAGVGENAAMVKTNDLPVFRIFRCEVRRSSK